MGGSSEDLQNLVVTYLWDLYALTLLTNNETQATLREVTPRVCWDDNVSLDADQCFKEEDF